ncbi:MAG: signal recognition particle-docking protein FtsY [Bacillota bacterium]
MNGKEEKGGLFARLRQGLSKTRQSLSGSIDSVLAGFTRIDEELFEELEETLIAADVGVQATQDVLTLLRERARIDKVKDAKALRALIKQVLVERIEMNRSADVMEEDGQRVLLVAGINGVGKTTSIGKLAHRYLNQGQSVILAAADTFRAAAAEQLEIWGKRAGVPVIRHQEGSDPAAVVFDAAASFNARKADVLICDTAGRLHNKKNLMEELKKIQRVIERECPQAKRACYLVLDATTGQNGIEQARVFQECVNVTGIVLAKLDGTAKGGVAVAITSALGIPVRYVGVGEGMDDLQPFDAEAFVDAMF